MHSDFSGAEINGVIFDLSTGPVVFHDATLIGVSLSLTHGSETIIDLSDATAMGVAFDGMIPSWLDTIEDGVMDYSKM